MLRLRIQPRAKRDEIGAVHGDRLRVRINAPPVDGKANEHLVEFIAERFGVPKRRVVLISGASARDKQVRVTAPVRFPVDISRPDAL